MEMAGGPETLQVLSVHREKRVSTWQQGNSMAIETYTVSTAELAEQSGDEWM